MDNLYGLMSILIFFMFMGITLAMGSRSDKNISLSSFDNKFLSFNYPDYLEIVDQSTMNHCQIYIFNGTPESADPKDPKYFGSIFTTDSKFVDSIDDPIKNTNINGIPALEYHKDVFSNELFVPSKLIVVKFNNNPNLDSKPFLSHYGFILKNRSETSYDTIKNSLKMN